MIRVVFDPDTLTGEDRAWWDAWQSRAQRKTREYIEKHDAGEKCEFDSSVWSDLKAWLLRKVFYGKCAYCEVKITGSFFGEGEHYRPKGNVTVGGTAGKRAAQLGDGSAHGGYYWLAYDWRNLLPSCQRCNNAKSDQFPVAGSHIGVPAPPTSELNGNERPLLIYPYDDKPWEFLKFGKGGVVTAIDDNPRGAETIRVFDLNREELMEERWEAQARALQGLESQVGRLFSDSSTDDRVNQYMGPAAPFSRAVRDWFRERVRIVSQQLQELGDAD